MAKLNRSAIDMYGGCQCGAIRYQLAMSPKTALLCHCRMCQRATGGLFGAYVTALPGTFSWSRGAASNYQSSDLAYRYFCGRCGTPMAFHFRGAEDWSVTIGSLDEPEMAPAQFQVDLESRISWVRVEGNLPELTLEDLKVGPLTNLQSPEGR